MAEPLISVVVPAHNAALLLPHCLVALAASDLPRTDWELIVVDDASADSTAAVARRSADKVIELRGNARGPAFARNRGVDAARAHIVAFIDADVCVHSDVLTRFVSHFRSDGQLAAVLGSYDDEPVVRDFVSQYRNLLHHYVHQRNAGSSRSFWAGCGAVRRGVFIDAGMFDESVYDRPQIEDVELGYRMHDKGQRLVLDPSILGTHRKQWTLGGMIRSDFSQRGVPWTRLLLERRELLGGKSLSVGTADKLNIAALSMLVGCVVLLVAFRNRAALAATIFFLIVLVVLNRALIRWYSNKRGPGFATGAFFMHLVYLATNIASLAYGSVAHFFSSARSGAKAAQR